MKVFDLACELNHRFEGWFGSAHDYEDQRARGLIACPICGSGSIQKLLSAPRLNLSGQTAPESPASPVSSGSSAPDLGVLQALVQKVAEVLVAHTEDVGPRFAAEARRIRDGAAPDRPIRGQATADEARVLQEEGIEVFAWPMPDAARGPLH